MKNWNKPELQELDINNTEYYAWTGAHVDGQYTSNDGRFTAYTYSGAGPGSVDYD